MCRGYSIVDTLELLLMELGQLTKSGPQFEIHHRFHIGGRTMHCGPGEEIASVHLVHRARPMLVALPLSLLFVFECLARSRHIPLSAAQIAATIRSSPFYRQHGRNSGVINTRKITRSAVKVYLQRIRKALDSALSEAGIPLAAEQILVSRETGGNQVLYQLVATLSWSHSELTD